MLAVAAWRLHWTVGGDLSQLEFLSSVVEGLLIAESTGPEKSSAGPRSPVSLDVRGDGIGHHLEDYGSRGRCKVCKKSSARLQCVKCCARLHQSCSVVFHAPTKN